MRIKPIQRKSVAEEVFDQISSLIVSREWQAGEKLPSENELGSMFNVSRVSIRAALQKLIAIGLLESRVGEGTFVIKTTPANYFKTLLPNMILTEHDDRDILELRRGIETESVMLAAQRATPEDVDRIEAIAEQMTLLKEQEDLAEYIAADFSFHMEVAKASKNKMIMEVMLVLKDILFLHYTDMVKGMGPQLAYECHQEILAAIKAKDPLRAAAVVGEMTQRLIDGMAAAE